MYTATHKDGILRIAFAGQPAPNTVLVVAARQAIQAAKLPGGRLLKVTGPASLPIAFTIAHEVGHLYAAVAVYDPKLLGFVVAVSHDPEYGIGSLLF